MISAAAKMSAQPSQTPRRGVSHRDRSNVKVIFARRTDPEGRQYPWLTIGQEYEVLGIEADDYRILCDPHAKPFGNVPCLYDPSCFRIIDPDEPSFWVCQIGDDGERYCYPPDWNEVGFFEDFFDGVESAVIQFWDGLKKYHPETWAQRNRP